MSRPNAARRAARSSIAVGLGAAVANLLLFGTMAAFNRGIAPPPEAPAVELRRVRLDADLPPPPPPVRPPSEARRVSAEPMEIPILVDVPRPSIRPLDLPIDIGLSDLRLPAVDLPGTPAALADVDGTSSVSLGELDQAPREISAPMPAYPLQARRAGIEGVVETKLLLALDGTVERLEIIRWEGHASFVETVRRACSAWRFTPAMRGGRAVRVWKPYVVRFRLDD